jgi:hypothetical protein
MGVWEYGGMGVWGYGSMKVGGCRRFTYIPLPPYFRDILCAFRANRIKKLSTMLIIIHHIPNIYDSTFLVNN